MPCYPDSAEFVSPKQESFPYDAHQLGHEKKKIECRSKAEAPLSHFPATYPKYRPPRSSLLDSWFSANLFGPFDCEQKDHRGVSPITPPS